MKRATRWISVATLAIGGSLCILGVVVTALSWGIEATHHRLHRLIPSVTLLLVTSGYTLLYLRNRWSIAALLSYLGSFLVLGLVLSYWINGFAKKFAPANAAEAHAASISGVVWIGVAVLLSVGTYIFVWHRAALLNHPRP